MGMPHYFGVRHLSPCGAYELVRFLDETDPETVLVEGPSDLNDMMADICSEKTVPPFAVMAYTQTLPVRTVVYPMAVYSPEYQAILWAGKHNKKCRFIDLPSGVFLSLEKIAKEDRDKEKTETKSVYERLEELLGEPQETWWERNFEHNSAYRDSVIAYGKELREAECRNETDYAENLVRESYMKRQIEDEMKTVPAERIVVVTGAYHTEGLKNCIPMTDSEIKTLPSLDSLSTLMPYSYYRLSSRSGYGAGNKAPAYYELLWDSLTGGEPDKAVYSYLSNIADYQRKHGGITSSAEVIEASRLAFTLAQINGNAVPALADLRDAAVACIGHGHFAEIAQAAAFTEIGTKIGSLPEGVSRTAMQEDFYRQLEDLKLEKYRSAEAQTLDLDLRENLRVKTEKSAFLDLHRSFFLNRLVILGIDFAADLHRKQDNATWAEMWSLKWTPEAEIQIVESSLHGDTVELAAGFVLKEKLDAAASVSDVTEVIELACLCGMEGSISDAVRTLQSLAVDSASFTEIAAAAEHMSASIKFGSIRKLDTSGFIPVLSQIFYRGCLLMISACRCDANAVREIIPAIEKLNRADADNDFISTEEWVKVLTEASERDDINTKASGYAAAELLERGLMDSSELSKEVRRRLSRGMPADLGAAWFEGISMKNHYALITRLSLWEQLSLYIDTLDDDEFRRALVFLRRAFSSFSASEKDQIAENLGEIWGMNASEVSEMLNDTVTEEQQQMIDSLDDFDFGDL